MAYDGQTREFSRRVREAAIYGISTEPPGATNGIFDGASAAELADAVAAMRALFDSAGSPVEQLIEAALAESVSVTPLQADLTALAAIGS